MKSFRADSLALDAYRMIDVPMPEPAADQVRIKIAACGLGYVDGLIADGKYQWKPPLPHVPGAEIAGTIDALGSNVGNFAIGDRVLCMVGHGCAEYLVTEAANIYPAPATLSLEQASGFPLNYLTALHGLRHRGRLKAGEVLLITGAAGGVGVAAIQVGLAMGATVIAAASTEAKRAFALENGAHAVIDTDPIGWRDRLKTVAGDKGVDVVFDITCGPLFESAFRSLNWNGRHLVVGFVGGPIPSLPANLPLLKCAELVGVVMGADRAVNPGRSAEDMRQLLDWAEEGVVRPPVGRVFPFSETAAALDFAMSGESVGKVVVRVA